MNVGHPHYTSPPPYKMPMSITQGLAELKLLDKRLRKGIQNLNWAEVATKGCPVDTEGLKKRAQSEYQSYIDLVSRRDIIKRAIVMANAATQVKIGKWEGSVAEAIEHKASITHKTNLLNEMRSSLMSAKAEYAEAVKETEQRLDRLLQSELGKDVRTNPDTIAALTTSFHQNNKVELCDPLDLSKKVSDLEDEIDSFLTNVDWVLSEANGKTIINV